MYHEFRVASLVLKVGAGMKRAFIFLLIRKGPQNWDEVSGIRSRLREIGSFLIARPCRPLRLVRKSMFACIFCLFLLFLPNVFIREFCASLHFFDK